MQKIKILTSQNVSIEYPLALVGERVIANVLDALIMGAYAFVCGVLITIMGGKFESIIYFVMLAPLGFYHLVFEIFMNGQTIGMRMRNTKVIRLDGQELTVGNCLLRWLFRLVDITITGGSVGILSIAFSDNGQRLGDMAAGTTVVKMKQRTGVIRDTVLVEELSNHEVQFPEARNLSDQDIRLVKEVLAMHNKESNFRLVETMAGKIKSTLSIKTEMYSPRFLDIIIKDHQKLTGNF